jgi:ABC-type lipoprotein export system ATPase subunit
VRSSQADSGLRRRATGNLDSHTSAEILELLGHAVSRYGKTTVMVTHDPNAAAIADRIPFLADGRIVRQLGTRARTRCSPPSRK